MLDLIGKAAGGYVRASKDTGIGSDVEGMSVEGQEDDIKVAAEDLGVRLVDVYNDNNLSGSRFATKERENWLRLLGDIESGRIEVLILWELSRGSRKNSEWGAFLDLVEERGVPIHCISHERTYNPRNHKDMEILQLEGVKSHSESNLISVRVRRGHKKARKLGRPHGPATFGWRRVYDEDTGRMLTQAVEEAERPFVEDAYRRVIAGEPVLSIARDWARRCKLPEDDPEWMPMTRRGNPWSYISVRHLLKSPVHIGRFYDTVTGDLCEGNWDGFIDEADWWSAQKLLAARSQRFGSRPAKHKYLLTYIARCGVCDSYMGSVRQRGIPMLECAGINDDRTPKESKKHTAIRMDWVDDYVVGLLLERMRDPEAIARLTARPTKEAAAARARLAELEADLQGAWDRVRARKLKLDRYEELAAIWEPEIERLREESEQGLDVASRLAMQFKDLADESGLVGEELAIVMRDAWDDLPLRGQREVVKRFTRSITVNPVERKGGRRAFEPERVIVL